MLDASKMTKLMYDAPSFKDVERIVVTDKFIELDNGEPEIFRKSEDKAVC